MQGSNQAHEKKVYDGCTRAGKRVAETVEDLVGVNVHASLVAFESRWFAVPGRYIPIRCFQSNFLG